MSSQINKGLKEAIQKNELIIFAGAGTSFPLGLPTWKELVIEIIGRINESDSIVNSLKELLEAGGGSGTKTGSQLKS